MKENNIKNVHSNLYFVSDIARTAEFYKNLGFAVKDPDGYKMIFYSPAKQ